VRSRGVIFVLAAAGFGFVLVTAAAELIKTEPPSSALPTSIASATRLDLDNDALAACLKVRGASYVV
jgi:hypothetical protein